MSSGLAAGRERVGVVGGFVFDLAVGGVDDQLAGPRIVSLGACFGDGLVFGFDGEDGFAVAKDVQCGPLGVMWNTVRSMSDLLWSYPARSPGQRAGTPTPPAILYHRRRSARGPAGI